MSSVGDDYPNQQYRVRELLKIYQELGTVGEFGAIKIEQVLQRADQAAISGDIVEIMRSYDELKWCE